MKCCKGAILQLPLEESVIAAVIEYYRQYTGPDGHDHCLAVIKSTIQNEQTFVSQLIMQLRQKLDDIEEATPSSDHSGRTLTRTCGTINTQISESDPRYRTLLERRISSLTHIPLTEDEIPEILPAFQEFATNLESQLRSPDTESRLSTIRRCISSISLDAAASSARVCVRELPSLLGILDVGPQHKMDILTTT